MLCLIVEVKFYKYEIKSYVTRKYNKINNKIVAGFFLKII